MKYVIFKWLLIALALGVAVAIPRVSTSSNFFEVTSIHDFFEILGSIATVCAVALAIYSINTWKVQIGASSDHELARRLAVCLRRYRISVIAAWHSAESAAAQIEHKTWIGDGGNDNFLVGIYQSHIAAVEQARAELGSVALECAVIWRDVFESGFEGLYLIDLKCCGCIDCYLHLLIRGTFDERAFMLAESTLEKWREFAVMGVVDDASIKKYFDSVSAPLEIELNNKLLKGRS